MPKILLADDEPNILVLLEMVFRDEGMTVITASDGQQAIQLAKQEKPDIILTDVIMPHKTGFEVCKAVREDSELEETPVIILSALNDEFNKLTGFEEGADDYITKPFSVDEVKARVRVLLDRYSAKPRMAIEEQKETISVKEAPVIASDSSDENESVIQLPTGIPVLDEHLFGGVPKGSNLLVIGPLGSGKSSFARQFIAGGLNAGDRNLWVALDDNPKQIRKELQKSLSSRLSDYETHQLIRFVDAYSWTTMAIPEDEAFVISGMLDLNQLAGVISDAGYELGQTVQAKLGGRRVIDSISSLLIHFELPVVQRFITQVARTAVSFGDVTTLFLIEEGTVNDQVLNNIKYLMDGVIEFKVADGQRQVRVCSMKWTNYSNQWGSIA